MYHYDPGVALEELTDEGAIPDPRHLRDMILRSDLTAEEALEMNRLFLKYQPLFAEAQKLAGAVLKKLAESHRKA